MLPVGTGILKNNYKFTDFLDLPYCHQSNTTDIHSNIQCVSCRSRFMLSLFKLNCEFNFKFTLSYLCYFLNLRSVISCYFNSLLFRNWNQLPARSNNSCPVSYTQFIHYFSLQFFKSST